MAKKNLPQHLHIEKVECFSVQASVDEYRTTNTGFYSNRTKAYEKSIGAGWYGSDGSVFDRDNVYADTNGNLFLVEPVGKFTDLEEEAKNAITKSIMSKLSPEEVEFVKKGKLK
jgi:hypothetical protein